MKHLWTCILIFLFCTGCSVFQKGSYPHHSSCGPEALYDAMERMNFDASRFSISREILDNHECYSLFRDVMSMFDKRAKGITFPEEIKSYLSKRNIKISILPVESLKKLTFDKTAIVLVRDKGTLNYHWGCFPVTPNLSSFFGIGKTTILRVILLEKM
jgi:hypothetical protein